VTTFLYWGLLQIGPYYWGWLSTFLCYAPIISVWRENFEQDWHNLKSSPGTETDFFAGYRACVCLEGYYRTHLFEECYKCGQGGLLCQDDYASLKTGHWWQWSNETYKQRYREFIENLLASSPALDNSSIKFPFPIPTPYKCPVEESCKGGLDSLCENGYEGPLRSLQYRIL